jgi:parvulin-like peptidyl-prolyl isomerase
MNLRLTPRGLGALTLLAASASLLFVASNSAGAAHVSRFINGVPDSGQFLPDTVVLARINERAYTVKEYVYSYFASYAEDRPSQDSLGRVEFLNTLVNKDVLGRTALAAGYKLDFEDRAALREHRERVLSNLLYMRAVVDSAIATEADIQRVYEQFKYQQHLRHIQFADQATAERVRLDLQRGHISWKDAVKRYSTAKNDRGPDGDLGWVMRPAVTFAIGEMVYGLNPGEMSQVFEDEDGFQIVQSVERKPIPAPALESSRNAIVDQIRKYKAGEISDRLQILLSARARLVFDTVNVAWAAKFFPDAQKMDRDDNGATTLNINPNVPEFAASDTSKVLARWEAGEVSLGDFLHYYTDISPIVRPSVSTPAAMSQQIGNMVLEPYKARLAEERGYDRDTMAVVQFESKLEQILVEKMYQDSVTNKVHVTKAERQQYYEKHKNSFVTYPSVRFAAISRKGKPAADSLIARLKSGTRAEDVITADSLAGTPSGSIQTLRENEHGVFHKLVFEELRPGQVSTIGPDKTGVYGVVQLLEYNSGRQLSFAESEGMVDANLQNLKAEALLQAMLKRLRKRYHIMSRPELVMQVLLYDPTL